MTPKHQALKTPIHPVVNEICDRLAEDRKATAGEIIKAIARRKKVGTAKIQALWDDRFAPEAPKAAPTKKAPRAKKPELQDRPRKTPLDEVDVEALEALIADINANGADEDPSDCYLTRNGNRILKAEFFPATKLGPATVSYRVRLANGKSRPRSCSPRAFIEEVQAQ